MATTDNEIEPKEVEVCPLDIAEWLVRGEPKSWTAMTSKYRHTPGTVLIEGIAIAANWVAVWNGRWSR